MKSLMSLWKNVLYETSTWCRTSTTLDLRTAQRRFEYEGESFLTITLTNFGKDFEKSLDQGFVGSNQFAGFRRAGGLPTFLSGFLRLVFERGSGTLLEDPSIEAIRAVRQLTLMFGKVLLPCSDERVNKAIDGYIQCEKEVKRNDQNIDQERVADFVRVGSLLFGRMFRNLDLALARHDYSDMLPKHGPGATADRLRGNRKWDNKLWTERLEAILPAGEGFLLPNWRYFPDLENVDLLEPGNEIPVRVITVPKTLKTPRIIAIEPTHMQYAQQALLAGFLKQWRQDDILMHMLGFDDQDPNRDLARTGSVTGQLATLDLSEASDRVSNQHVLALTSKFPLLAEAFQACRSRKADVNGKIIRLAKYASMGSALCFPVEAAVFLTVIFVGIERAKGTRLSTRDIQSFVGKVRVFGDDIIVPVDFVHSVRSELESFGFKVNADKSFWTGKFRESCGKEFYDGHDVSIVRMRREFPTELKHVQRVISMVDLRNQLYYAGFWYTCQWMDGKLEKLLRKKYPTVHPDSPALGRHSILPYQVDRHDERLHRPLVKGYVVTSKIPKSKLDGLGALQKFFLQGDRFDEKHLERAGRPLAVDIKQRWTTPF